MSRRASVARIIARQKQLAALDALEEAAQRANEDLEKFRTGQRFTN